MKQPIHAYFATLRRHSRKSSRSIRSCSSGDRFISHSGRLGICILRYLFASSGSTVGTTAFTSRSIITAAPFSVSKLRWDRATVSRKSSYDRYSCASITRLLMSNTDWRPVSGSRPAAAFSTFFLAFQRSTPPPTSRAVPVSLIERSGPCF